MLKRGKIRNLSKLYKKRDLIFLKISDKRGTIVLYKQMLLIRTQGHQIDDDK